MLYGMDDYDEYSSPKKLNIKKVIIVSIIIVLVLFLILYSIINRIFNKHVQKLENNNSNLSALEKNEINEEELINSENEQQEIINENYEENIENNVENINSENEIKENKNEEKIISNDKKNKDAYNGNHFQIPEHDLNKLQSKFVPVFNENAPELIKNIYYSDEKQVYLTFDDGPSKDVTPQILDILKENDVKATFFVLGARVELYPEVLNREYDEGHYIANHGYSHKYSAIYQSKDTVFEEYKMTEDIIKNALNNQDFNTYLFRFPGGSSGGHYESIKSEARDLFRSYGIAFTNWNCLTGDAENKTTVEACMNEMIRTKGDQNSIILLMHDANDKIQTVEALPEIIQYFRNEGYTFKNFYEIFK